MTKKIILFILVFVFLGALITLVYAGGEHNISGYAWSENIGWISFNNTTGGGSNYGVNIDSSTGDLSGYAWSEHIGWISFNRSNTGNPPQAPFNGGSGPIARYNSDTDEITGWFRVLANGGGWDGWIKFYNVTLDANGDWHGWAWSDLVVGWVSFNSSEGGGSSYKVTSVGVVNNPPTANLLDPIKENYCSNPSHYFSWIYSDPDSDNQSRFKLQIDNDSNFSSLTVNRDISGLSNPSPTNNNQTVLVTTSPDTPSSNQLAYYTTYYWRVMVWDDQSDNSEWTNGSPFTTELHKYPSVDFNWSPTNPSVNEDVQFTDLSDCFDADGDCDSWLWNFINGDPDSSTDQNPIIQFTSDEEKAVTLQVTDSDNYTCPEVIDVDVNVKLPSWKEILPW